MASPSPPPASLGRTIAIGSAWLGVLNVAGGLAVLGLTSWLLRVLPDAKVAFGCWAIASVVLLVAMQGIELGLPAALMQADELPEHVTGGIILLLLLSGLGGAALFWLAAAPVAALVPELPRAQVVELLRWLSLAVVAIAAGLGPKAMLQRQLRFRTVACIESGSTLLFVGLGASLAVRHGIVALGWATVARHANEAVLYWAVARPPARALLSPADWGRLRGPVRFGLGMGVQSLLGSAIRQGDALLVGVLVGPGVTVYKAAQALVMLPFSKLLVYVARAAFPSFARIQDDEPRLLRGLGRMQHVAALAVFPALAGLAAVAPRLVALYLGPQLASDHGDGALVLRLLAIGAAGTTWAYTAGVVLNAHGAARPMAWRQVVAAIGVVLLMLAGSAAGLLGVTAGRVAAAILLAVLLLDLARQRLGFTSSAAWRAAWQPASASLLMLGVVAAAGLAADRLWPGSTAAAVAGGASRGAVAVLAGQVVAGVVAYAAFLRVVGVDVLAPARLARERLRAGRHVAS